MATDSNKTQAASSNISEEEIGSVDKEFIKLAAALEISSESLSKFNRRMTSSAKKLDIMIPKITELMIGLNGLTQNSNELSSGFSSLSSKYSKFLTNLNDTSMDEIGLKFADVTDKVDDLSKSLADVPKKMKDVTKSGSKINNIEKFADKANKKLKSVAATAKKVGSALGKAGKAATSIGTDKFKTGTELVDNYIKSNYALSKIKDKNNSQAGLMNKVNDAASRSGVSYSSMADAVGKIGSLGTFKSNDSAIAFTELMQKSLKLGGSDQSIADVSKSLSDGSLQEDEFNSLIEGAPKIGEALSASTGKSIPQLQEMAKQGMITADLLKNSMFAAGDQIDDEFGKQPKTFADMWIQITNSAQKILNPIMDLISKMINSEEFQAGINFIVNGLEFIAQKVTSLISFIMNNGKLINALLFAIGAVMLGVLAAAAVSWIMIYGPILLVIGAIVGIIYMLQSLGVSFEDIFGAIGGVVGVTIAGIYNLFIGLFELILGIVNSVANRFIEFGNLLANVVQNPISTIIYSFQKMADGVLGVIESIASALDFVFGSKMADSISGLRTNLKSNADSIVKELAPNENYQDVYKTVDFSVDDFGLKRMSYDESWNEGKSIGKDVFNNVRDLASSLSSDKGYDYTNLDNITEVEAKNPIPVEGNVNVDMEDEDLDYLRQMAERDYIANIAANTLAPNISVSFGDVHETADVNQLFSRIRTILQEQIAVAPEGVY